MMYSLMKMATQGEGHRRPAVRDPKAQRQRPDRKAAATSGARARLRGQAGRPLRFAGRQGASSVSHRRGVWRRKPGGRARLERKPRCRATANVAQR